MENGSILLINPWIYDFAAYDFWLKPVGLLSVGSVLRQFGYEIDLIDCLDRNHPALEQLQPKKRPREGRFGTGKFFREIVPKPEILAHVPRYFCRYGMPEEIFLQELLRRAKPSAILVTSGMTYWYPGVFRAIELLKTQWPDVPVILGGIYASLCFDHARQKSGADFVVQGPGEMAALALLDKITGVIRTAPPAPFELNQLPLPAYDLYSKITALPVITSRGCPFCCPFCATQILEPLFKQRNVDSVVAEIKYYAHDLKVTNFAFWDDALLINRDRHIKKILQKILESGLNVFFHLPNGVHPHLIDAELAELFWECRFRTIRLSFESAAPERQKKMGNKVSNDDLAKSVDILNVAGFQRKNLDVYLLMGLPNQPFAEVEESMKFVNGLGAKIRLSTFSPIPGTPDWEHAFRKNGVTEPIDPLLSNKSIYPLHPSPADIRRMDALKLRVNQLNDSL